VPEHNTLAGKKGTALGMIDDLKEGFFDETKRWKID
jgi:hypothetical protein